MTGELQKLFARRVREEMEARALSTNAVSRAAKTLGYRIGKSTVARILAGDQDPTLEKIAVLSEVFGVPAWFLLTDGAEQRVIKPPKVANVLRLPDPYPRILGKKEEKVTPTRTRTKRR